jgi:hypothetical protein
MKDIFIKAKNMVSESTFLVMALHMKESLITIKSQGKVGLQIKNKNIVT